MSHLALIVATVALCLPSARSITAQTPPPKQPPSGLQIGGYRVAIGMSIEEVNRQLRSVFRVTYTGDARWRYELDGAPMAELTSVDGKVKSIVKHITVGGRMTASDRALQEMSVATEEFRALTRENNCTRPEASKVSGQASGAVTLAMACGSSTLSISTFKYPTGELGVSASIKVE